MKLEYIIQHITKTRIYTARYNYGSYKKLITWKRKI